jgi:hypothetical protein
MPRPFSLYRTASGNNGSDRCTAWAAESPTADE